MELLKDVLVKNNLLEREGFLITDNGAENKGDVKEWINKPGTLWKQLIAQLDITQSNSMAEAANKILKYQFLRWLTIDSIETLMAALPDILKIYNNMPLDCLHGLTPNEVINGKIPDKDFYKQHIATAQKERVIINQKINCKKINNFCADSG
jgi:hypothetical protein